MKAATRVRTAALAAEVEKASLLLWVLVEEGALPVLVAVLLTEPLDAEAEPVGMALPEVVVAAAAAPGVPVDEAAAVELAEPMVEPLTMERATLLEVELLWVM